MLSLLLLIWGVSALGMAAIWAVSMRVNNVGYVDVAWAGLMAVAALLVGAFGEGAEVPRGLVALFGSLWGTRLCLHLLQRVLHESEDGRYQALRAAWNGSRGKFFLFFQAQALIVTLFALPFIAAASRHDNSFDIWMIAAIATWLLSVGGESLADHQLARFRADPGNRGKSCRAGLWSWSRHPNYFFEWLHWFAYVLLAVESPIAWLAWAGPLVMYAFLRWISGIPWTEQQALRTRGEDYARYQRTTPMLIPWFPKEDR